MICLPKLMKMQEVKGKTGIKNTTLLVTQSMAKLMSCPFCRSECLFNSKGISINQTIVKIIRSNTLPEVSSSTKIDKRRSNSEPQ